MILPLSIVASIYVYKMCSMLHFPPFQTYYYIESVLTSGYVLSAPANANGGTITTATKVASATNQLWRVQYNRNGTITLRPRSSPTYAMDIGTAANGITPVVLLSYTAGKVSQQWTQPTEGSGRRLVPSSNSASSMTIQGGSTTPGTPVILQPTSSSNSQIFNIVVRVMKR